MFITDIDLFFSSESHIKVISKNDFAASKGAFWGRQQIFRWNFLGCSAFSGMRFSHFKPSVKPVWVSHGNVWKHAQNEKLLHELSDSIHIFRRKIILAFICTSSSPMKIWIESDYEKVSRYGRIFKHFWDTQKVSRRVRRGRTSSPGRYLYPKKFHWQIYCRSENVHLKDMLAKLSSVNSSLG